MRNTDKYWADRALALEATLHKDAEITFDKLDAIILQALDLITQLITEWYGRYMPEGKGSYQEAKKRLTPSELRAVKRRLKRFLEDASDLDDADIKHILVELDRFDARTRVTRLEALQQELKTVSHLLHTEEKRIIEELVTNQYRQGYYRTYFDVFQNLGLGFPLELLSDSDIQAVLDKAWSPDGLTYYERLLRNDNLFLTDAQKTIIKHLHLGTSPNKVVSEVANTMNRSRRSASAIVMSESAFFANESRANCMRELDIDRYRIVATLDMKTSEICREMDGKVFAMKEYLAGATAPPFHVRCRSTTAPYYPDMDSFAERIARGADGSTYYVPANMQYPEWYDKYIKD